jgi:hypothetical protein
MRGDAKRPLGIVGEMRYVSLLQPQVFAASA